MGTPVEHLPGPISESRINDLLVSIGLPRASSISRSEATAQYHAIYRIRLPEKSPSLHKDLMLRVSGSHLPTIKTANEVGVMTWISQNTSIPIPDLIAYDETMDNQIGHEYTLLSCVSGHTLSDVYDSLSPEQIESILLQLIDILTQLNEHEWSQIGGLRRNKQGDISVAQVVDEAFWQSADIKQLWPQDETITSLNILGPYASYVDLVTAQIRKYIYLTNIHPSLAFLRDLIPRLEAFLEALAQRAPELNNVKLCLAHKDLHFANMLYDIQSGKLTAVLDWEFAGIVPMPKWNPTRAFLWNGRDDSSSGEEKQRLLELFTRLCVENGTPVLADAAYTSSLQDSMQTVADYLRALTEVAPRGQRQDSIPQWVAEVRRNLEHFGV